MPATQRSAGLRIGLTGGIGSGKSTVARCWQALGARVVDTDAIARQLTLPGGAALPAIAAEFGPQMLLADGALDRDRMRQQVFADPASKTRLEAILHPLIGTEAERQAALAPPPGDSATIVFDVPLLVESGRWRAKVDRVLVVDCRECTQAARVLARNGWSVEAVQAVMRQQASRSERRACADAVIWNEGLSESALAEQVRQLAVCWAAQR